MPSQTLSDLEADLVSAQLKRPLLEKLLGLLSDEDEKLDFNSKLLEKRDKK